MVAKADREIVEQTVRDLLAKHVRETYKACAEQAMNHLIKHGFGKVTMQRRKGK